VPQGAANSWESPRCGLKDEADWGDNDSQRAPQAIEIAEKGFAKIGPVEVGGKKSRSVRRGWLD
jgi:hypothetical protein